MVWQCNGYDKEIYYIKFYNSYCSGYNCSIGGQIVQDNQGEKHPNHKLTEEDVFQIREYYNQHKEKDEVYQLYQDNSTVYDKPRKVSMNKWAANFGIGGEYRAFTHWGVSARINYILAYSGEYSVRYHDKEWMVQPHYPMKGADDISQLGFSVGINYHF